MDRVCFWVIFTARRSCASVVLSIVILSVRLSVVTGVICDKTKEHTVDIMVLHESVIALVLGHQQRLVGDVLFHLKSAVKMSHSFEKRRMTAYNISTVTASDKSLHIVDRKSTTRFPAISG